MECAILRILKRKENDLKNSNMGGGFEVKSDGGWWHVRGTNRFPRTLVAARVEVGPINTPRGLPQRNPPLTYEKHSHFASLTETSLIHMLTHDPNLTTTQRLINRAGDLNNSAEVTFHQIPIWWDRLSYLIKSKKDSWRIYHIIIAYSQGLWWLWSCRVLNPVLHPE